MYPGTVYPHEKENMQENLMKRAAMGLVIENLQKYKCSEER